MSGNFKKEDLRIKKTYKALINSLIILLGHRNFGQITVNDLCEKAQISRAAFYTHFNDKYDLLRYWLKNLKPEIIKKEYTYKQLEESINIYIQDNSKIIKNLVENANNETLDILREFMCTLLEINKEEKEEGLVSYEHTILTNFCSGGMLNLLLWQAKNKFPQETQMMNSYFYKMLVHLLEWDIDQK